MRGDSQLAAITASAGPTTRHRHTRLSGTPMNLTADRRFPTASAASAIAECTTDVCGKVWPTQQYAGLKICSMVATTLTDPLGSTSMLAVGEPSTTSAAASTTAPLSLTACSLHLTVALPAKLSHKMRQATGKRNA
jgi:hypothetical protein